MGLMYFDNLSWGEITRDERTFCAEAFYDFRNNPKKLVSLLREKGVQIDFDANWELGFEVHFYRDFFAFHNMPMKGQDVHYQRAFDLCLFSNDTIVIVEAKVQQGFGSKQNEAFEKDKDFITGLIQDKYSKKIRVELVALASSEYIANVKSGLNGFTTCISWHDLFKATNNKRYQEADQKYGK